MGRTAGCCSLHSGELWPVTAIIAAGSRGRPTCQGAWFGLQDLDTERMADRDVRGMLRRAVAARTCRERAQKVDLGKELQVVTGTRRARLHEVLASVTREARAHEDVQHVVDMSLGQGKRQAGLVSQCPDQIGMAAMVISAARQQLEGVGVAARTDHVMHGTAELVEAVPVERVTGDGRHRAHVWERRPHAVAGLEVRPMQSTGLAGVEAFGKVSSIPEIEIAYLRALGAVDPEEAAGRNPKAACLAWRNDDLELGRELLSRCSVHGHVGCGQGLDRIAEHRTCRTTVSTIQRLLGVWRRAHATFSDMLDGM